MEKVEELKCSFCSLPKSKVKHLVQGQKANICDVCAKVCKGLLENKSKVVSMTDDDPEVA
jgi:ATP-dependent protease Clp ATPase subunit